jgi:hypothetical protein
MKQDCKIDAAADALNRTTDGTIETIVFFSYKLVQKRAMSIEH